MFRGLAIVLCVTGCLREPKFTPQDAPDDAPIDTPIDAAVRGGVMAVKGGGGATVTGELGTLTYSASFATSGLHLLDALSINGQAILGHNASIACNAENQVGIAVFPAERVSQSLPATAAIVTANEPATRLTGPAVGQVFVSWSTSYTCGATPKQLDGESTFTFFPDGRIVRYESFRQEMPGMPPLADCDCTTANTQFFPTTFITFDPGAFDRVVGEMPNSDQEMLMPGEQVTLGRYSCAYRNGRQFAIAWPDQETRIRRAPGSAANPLAFVYDLQQMATSTIPETYMFATRSMMFLDNESIACARAGTRASNHVTPNRLLVNQIPLDLTSIDGIYGGQQPGSQIAGFVVSGPGTATIEQSAQGSIPAGFAVWLGWGNQTVLPRAIRTPASPSPDPWYLMQQPTPQSAVFWFRDGLGAGERIEIRID